MTHHHVHHGSTGADAGTPHGNTVHGGSHALTAVMKRAPRSWGVILGFLLAIANPTPSLADNQGDLIVTGEGTGSGTVTGDTVATDGTVTEGVIDCTITEGVSDASGTTCKLIDVTKVVRLTAKEAPGSTFTGWKDEECGPPGAKDAMQNPCELLRGVFDFGDVTAVASFKLETTTTTAHRLTVQGSGSGDGRVSGNGISCAIKAGVASASDTCRMSFDEGTSVSLTAEADSGHKFTGWTGGACNRMTNPLCEFTIDSTKTVTARFSVACPAVNDIECDETAKDWTHKFYRSYYGRCAECGGFKYWCKKIEEAISQVPEGRESDLTRIVTAFVTSQEFTDKYGDMSDEELIKALYRQMFSRDAEPGGLNFYRGRMETYRQEWRDAHGGDEKGATEYAWSRIVLDILNGIQGDDLDVLDVKISACVQD
ncbi:DUF4214 domain-containing protein [Candidatus Thiosymbion oneisti]|uniref:DUF4214 domain-containing protein n=1 Tax=Candidatus Thiosymbion oneisti TaxID=589554 RepID=UPI00159F0F8E|nr:DUF4214 domain-containing protein [Candidatus Thiosymbion oneisti]